MSQMSERSRLIREQIMRSLTELSPLVPGRWVTTGKLALHVIAIFEDQGVCLPRSRAGFTALDRAEVRVNMVSLMRAGKIQQTPGHLRSDAHWALLDAPPCPTTNATE